jgi:hypothetical protein
MTGFKLLGRIAMLATLTVAQPQTYGTHGREVAATPWSAARMTDPGPSQRGEPMWIHGAGSGRAGRKSTLSPEIGAPHGIGGNGAHDDWPANMILG